MITNIILSLTFIVLCFIAVMIFAIGHNLSESKK